MGGSTGTSCYNCLRFLVVSVSLVAVIAALCLLLVACWVAHFTDWSWVAVALLGVGGTVVFIATMGCFGGLTQSRCFLVLFTICLMFIVVGELVLVGFLWFKHIDYDGLLNHTIRATVMTKYYPDNMAVVTYWDNVQQGLSCCGSSGPADWLESVYPDGPHTVKEIGIVSGYAVLTARIPRSCCRDLTSILCKSSLQVKDTPSLDPAVFFTQGCTEKIIQVMDNHLVFLLFACLGVLLLEILGIFFSLCLFCTKKKINDRKV